MKKLFTLLAMTLIAIGASSQTTTTVGAEDNSTPWWTAFSDYYAIPANGSLHVEFTNYTSKENNWSNFLIVLANKEGHTAEETAGYAEYAVLRADNYGWGACYDENTRESNWNWEQFPNIMDGAKVKLDIARSGSSMTVNADVAGADGNSYFQKYTLDTKEAAADIVCYLSVEKGHLVIDNTKTVIGNGEPAETTTVGAEDNSTTWWSAFSDYYTIPSGKTLHVEFTNYTAKAENYQNWLALITTTEREAEGYYEYFVLRGDNYAWGDGKNTWNDPSNADYWGNGAYELTSNFNWDTFKNDMDGAKVVMEVTNDAANNQIHLMAQITTADGKSYFENFTKKQAGFPTAVANTIKMFLTTEGGHLVIDNTKTTVDDAATTQIATATKAPQQDAIYHIKGMRVKEAGRGLYIIGGKKVISRN